MLDFIFIITELLSQPVSFFIFVVIHLISVNSLKQKIKEQYRLNKLNWHSHQTQLNQQYKKTVDIFEEIDKLKNKL